MAMAAARGDRAADAAAGAGPRAGDTRFIEGEHAERSDILDENDKATGDGTRPATYAA